MGPNSRTDLYQTLDFWAEHLHPVCRPIWLTRPPCVAADKNLSYCLFLVPSVQYAQSGPVSFFVLFIPSLGRRYTVPASQTFSHAHARLVPS